MTFNGKQITVGSITAVGALVALYIQLGLPLFMTSEAHAEDQKSNECRMARIEWSMANENLRYAKIDLKEDPESATLNRAVENYMAERDAAQNKIAEFC